MKQVVKPMLATEANFNKLRYPVCAQPKLDGIRGMMVVGMVVLTLMVVGLMVLGMMVYGKMVSFTQVSGY